MQLQSIGPEQGVEESMRWQTKSLLIESYIHHDEPLHRSRRYRVHGHKKGSKLGRHHIPLTYKFL
jgi:hypothetical protein